MTATTAVAASGSLGSLSGSIEDSAAQTLRKTTLGDMTGLDQSTESGTYSWLGIPFAEPPVENLRWKAPVPRAPWSQPFAATEYGEGCAQPGRTFSPAPEGPVWNLNVRDGLGTPVGDEDCLTLNIHRPATDKKDLPVLVFVHGGSNVVGFSGDPMYDGRALADKADAVVVTVNYRLGIFGWLDQLGTESGGGLSDSGNYGLLDQIEALRFVQDNAAEFGGNADNVTIMGESAGAVNVWALMASPLSEGLFDKAIPMSGGLQTTSPQAAETYARALGEAAAEEAGVDGADEGLRLLRDMPANDVIALSLRHKLDATPAVIVDDVVIPADPHAALAARAKDIPVLAGNTFEEGKLFGSAIAAHPQSEYDRFTMQYEFDPNQPSPYAVEDFIASQYLPIDGPGGWNEASDALTEQVFMGIVEDSMSTLQRAGNDRLYYYQFAWNNQPKPFDDVYGAVHAIDLPFIFGNFGRNVFSYAFSEANEPGRLELSAQMMTAVHNFVRTGSPQTESLGVVWQQWPESVVLDANDTQSEISTGHFE
ncbi:carboxylesterase family protein [Dietzia aerolata]|uniref:Carboxylic ester hydrolase n=1 Tax=Dietzia aerolata TaxID=595984 RepID=A0ABV5JPQ8_9ACTN